MLLFRDYRERQATTIKALTVIREGEPGHEHIFHTRISTSPIDAESKTDSRRKCLSLPWGMFSSVRCELSSLLLKTVLEQPAWRHVAGNILHLNHFDIYYSFYERILCGSYYMLTATYVWPFLHRAHRCLVLSFHMQKNDLMWVCGFWLFSFSKSIRKVVKHLGFFKETEFFIVFTSLKL